MLAVAFLPLLLFGPAPDPGLFYTGARKLLQGGSYYHDILDIKPPFIYWYYGLSLKLFGEAFLSVRLMDYLLQLCFTTLLGITLWRMSKDRLIAMLGPLLYALIYVGIGPENTTQLESYVGMALLPAMLLHLNARKSGRLIHYALAGLCYGVLLLYKPTFGLVLVGAITFEFLQPRTRLRQSLKHSAALFFAGLLPCIPWMLYLALSPDGRIAWEINQFINERHVHQFLHGGGARESIHRFMTNWNSEFGIGSLVLILVGLFYLIQQHRTKEASYPPPSPHNKWNLFLQLSTVQLVALLLSCAVEFWFFPYHISRGLLPFAILAALGTSRIIRFFHKGQGTSRFARFVVCCAAVPLIIYSPLARYVVASLEPTRTFLSTGSITQAQRASVAYFPFVPDLAALHIPALLKNDPNPAPSLFVISPNLGTIHVLTSTVPKQELIHGHQLTSRFTLPSWRARFVGMIQNNPPDYMLIQLGDPSMYIQGVANTPEGLEINGIWELIQENYQAIDSNGTFTLYRQR